MKITITRRITLDKPYEFYEFVIEEEAVQASEIEHSMGCALDEMNKVIAGTFKQIAQPDVDTRKEPETSDETRRLEELYRVMDRLKREKLDPQRVTVEIETETGAFIAKAKNLDKPDWTKYNVVMRNMGYKYISGQGAHWRYEMEVRNA